MAGVYIDGNVLGKRLDDIYKKTWENANKQEVRRVLPPV